ncbi:MAG: RecB-like helicase, partial [Campylobacterales bacterium]|nr:RecB-like helicase [Campylobacterales bacterium]
ELASKTWLERNTLNYRTFSKCYSEELDEYFVQLKDLLNKYYKIKEAFVLEKIINLYKIYEQTAKNIKKRFGGLSFSDVTYFAKKILSSIDKDFIYFRLDSKIEHILIDEFQDTSEQQVSILAPLIEEIVSGKGVNTNIDTKSFFFVGDTKQSIYRFRGGDWRLFYQTEKKYGLENKTLKINFRSSKNVVEYNNKVFEELYPNFVPQQSRMDAKKGYVEVRINSEIEKAIVDIIKDHLNRNVKPEDIAILVYTNDDSNKVADLIKSKFPKVGVITDNSGKLINHSVNRAIIECIKYLYYKEEIYLKSFNGIIGKDPFTEILEEISQLDLKSGVSNIGKKIVETYGLFSGDSNLSKFFNLLEKFEDIHSFISSIEKESEIIDKGEADGISILTVHKSKGLEFNHVIVCDRFSSRPPVNRDSLIFDYKESGKIFYRYKGRASFDNEYKEALERQKELVEKDLINSLYVALTRAKNELYIIAKEKSSSFEILDLKEEKIGEKEIFQLEQRSEEKKKEEKLTSRSYGKQKEFLHNEMEEIEGNFHHIYFGNAVHYCLEVISDFNERSLEIGLKSTQNRYGLYVDINRVRNSVENLLKDSYFLEITKENTYKEQSVVLDGKHFVIDLLCENNGEYIVCDYKSGSKKEEHKLQVINYINAVKTLKNSENVKGVLCYIGEKKIDWVKV